MNNLVFYFYMFPIAYRNDLGLTICSENGVDSAKVSLG